jgi:hypothetical protein
MLDVALVNLLFARARETRGQAEVPEWKRLRAERNPIGLSGCVFVLVDQTAEKVPAV